MEDSARAGGFSEPPQGAKWALTERTYIRAIIESQIGAFRERPYIRDQAGLLEALARGLARTLEDDFCWSLCFAPLFIRRLCYEGFLPICSEIADGTGLYVLLPKLHVRRCVLEFENLVISRQTRRRARAYTLSINKAFDLVVGGCVEQHGEDWLHPPMRSVLSQLAEAAAAARARAAAAGGASAAGGGGGGGASDGGSDGELGREPGALTAMTSFELWDQSGALVAGEVGCVSGCCYTSFSGFHRVANAGSVQMALTGRLLERSGFAFWDLGQDFAYKAKLGATLWPRLHFLECFHRVRDTPSQLESVAMDAYLLSHPTDLLGASAAGAAGGDGGDAPEGEVSAADGEFGGERAERGGGAGGRTDGGGSEDDAHTGAPDLAPSRESMVSDGGGAT